MPALTLSYPSTAQHVAYHAALRPDAPAVVVNAQVVTYATLHGTLCKMVQALRSFDPVPGQVWAVDRADTYLHLLTILAFEALGVATYSYHAAEAAHVADMLASVDRVICAPGAVPAGPKQVHEIDEGWFDAAMAAPTTDPLPDLAVDGEAPSRLIKGSGTTGRIRHMMQTARIQKLIIGQMQFRTGFTRQSRFLITGGFNIQAYHSYASACLRAGGACAFDSQGTVARTLVTTPVTHVLFLPLSLEKVLAELDDPGSKPPNLMVITNGGAVPDALRERLHEVLAAEVLESYGTNETNAICTMGPGGVGTVFPGVRVEVVDDQGQAITGRPGHVRVQSDCMVQGYLDDAAATRDRFRAGWFYPGDVAVMTGPRTLRLVGRADDLLNIGGIKLLPHELEAQIRADTPAADAALTTIAGADGVPRLRVALVLDDPDQLARIAGQVAALLPPPVGAASYSVLAGIPRTASGKVRRNALRDRLPARPDWPQESG